jgi:hypothetical protein
MEVTMVTTVMVMVTTTMAPMALVAMAAMAGMCFSYMSAQDAHHHPLDSLLQIQAAAVYLPLSAERVVEA